MSSPKGELAMTCLLFNVPDKYIPDYKCPPASVQLFPSLSPKTNPIHSHTGYVTLQRRNSLLEISTSPVGVLFQGCEENVRIKMPFRGKTCPTSPPSHKNSLPPRSTVSVKNQNIPSFLAVCGPPGTCHLRSSLGAKKRRRENAAKRRKNVAKKRNSQPVKRARLAPLQRPWTPRRIRRRNRGRRRPGLAIKVHDDGCKQDRKSPLIVSHTCSSLLLCCGTCSLSAGSADRLLYRFDVSPS